MSEPLARLRGDDRAAGFLPRWIIANALGELIGLGAVAGIGHVAVSVYGEPAGVGSALLFALAFTALGALEGLVVGVAQARVLGAWLPGLEGWVRATAVGAAVAWAIGMVPSTVVSLMGPDGGGASPEMGQALQLVLAAGLGAVAGPMLAFFQWRRLRTRVRRAAWWLPANAAAWAAGMPLTFAGAHYGASMPAAGPATLTVAASLLAAGAVVGAVHGPVMAWLIRREAARDG